ncbi:hypothetical protein [Verrucomicrobium sp. BvORR106]|uniref:hypothetical protein n=1 Tax=Verrucomicrobium sp. BvORR106 TaxID=1403819 RepID=UPI002240EA0D|nr:hypothetical protein [Verrucomicrobium sp. BvORR106]
MAFNLVAARSLCVAMVVMMCTAGLGSPVDDAIMILEDVARTPKERADAAGRIVRGLESSGGPIKVETKDHDAIARASLRLLDDKDADLREKGVELLWCIPPSSVDEAALQKITAGALNKSFAVRLIRSKGMKSSPAVQVLKDCIKARTDFISFGLAGQVAAARGMLEVKDDLIAAIVDPRFGVRYMAVVALAGFAKGTVPRTEALERFLADTEKDLKRKQETEEKGGSPVMPEEKQFVEVLKALLEASK